MTTSRQDRFVENERLFRIANERLSLLDGERIVEEEEHYFIVTKENVG